MKSKACCMLRLFRHNGENNSNRGFMVNQSLRSRLMFMAALPALLAALVMSRLWVPVGNTGGANVNPLQPMPIPDALRDVMEER